jgi:hypothetical protein
MSIVPRKQTETVDKLDAVLEPDSHPGSDLGKARFFGDKVQNYR